MRIRTYRGTLTPQESEAIRTLRRRGFAVAVITPADVGPPLRRKPIEDEMLAAGRQATQRAQEVSR
jgi:hypothetical protein